MTTQRITDNDRRAGRALRAWREENSLSRSVVARRLGVTQVDTIKSWEDGQARPLRFKDQLREITGWDWDNPPALFPRAVIEKALAEANGVRADAARALGVSRQTLGTRIKRLGIETASPKRLLGTTNTSGGRWRAQGHINGTTRYLGTYDTQEEAHGVFMEARRLAKEQAVDPPERMAVVPVVGHHFRYFGRRSALNGAWVEVVGIRKKGKVYVCPAGTEVRHLVHRKYLSMVPFDTDDTVMYENGRGKGAALNGLTFTVLGFTDNGRKIEVGGEDGTLRTLDPKFLSNATLDDEAMRDSQQQIRDWLEEWKSGAQPKRPERLRALEVAEHALGLLVAARKTT
jgi:DNA-binding XRE family transcriptional regulator